MAVPSLLAAGPSPLGAVPAGRNAHAAAVLAQSGNKKALAALPPDQQVQAVSGQFEAILLRQFLQDSVGKIMGGESGGAGGSIYGYLLTDVLAGKLGEGGGIGLAKTFQQQLSPHGHRAPTPAAPKGNP